MISPLKLVSPDLKSAQSEKNAMLAVHRTESYGRVST